MPNSVWHCWQVLAKTARPSVDVGRPWRAARQHLPWYSAISLARSAGRLADGAPDLADRCVELGVLEVAQLADEVGREVGGRDPLRRRPPPAAPWRSRPARPACSGRRAFSAGSKLGVERRGSTSGVFGSSYAARPRSAGAAQRRRRRAAPAASAASSASLGLRAAPPSASRRRPASAFASASDARAARPAPPGRRTSAASAVRLRADLGVGVAQQLGEDLRPARRASRTCRRPFSASFRPAQDRQPRPSGSSALPSASTSSAIASGVPIAATRRTMNGSDQRDLRRRRQRRAPRPGRRSASGSAAYQYISGRLWSPASSACASRPARIVPALVRAAAAAGPRPGTSRTTGDGSVRAIAANWSQHRRGDGLPVFGRELDRPGPDVRARRRRARARTRAVVEPAGDVQRPAAAEPHAPGRRRHARSAIGAAASRTRRLRARAPAACRRAWRTYQSLAFELQLDQLLVARASRRSTGRPASCRR